MTDKLATIAGYLLAVVPVIVLVVGAIAAGMHAL